MSDLSTDQETAGAATGQEAASLATARRSGDIRVSEIFGPTIQGEGVLIGLPTVFVRTGGCDFRCSWCDSMHSVDPAYRDQWLSMSTESVWQRVLELSGGTPLTVTLSGGNPAIQPFAPLIKLGHAAGYRFAIETQGSISRSWFGELDTLVLSPKPPSSGMGCDLTALQACVDAAGEGTETVLKIVVFDAVDYAWARDIAARFPALPVYLQPGNHTPPPADDDSFVVDQDGLNDRMLWLVDQVTEDRWFEARVLPQLHVILWGNKRGV